MYSDSVTVAFCETCVCGKTFSQPGTFTHHKRICSKTKKRLAEALVKAREVWSSRKKRRTGTSENAPTSSQSVDAEGSSAQDVINVEMVCFKHTRYLLASL